jgi:23S rRNA (cytidine1920-2'-O)/16S rRNA (cytidine1409-2'-O)-methyltransferase
MDKTDSNNPIQTKLIRIDQWLSQQNLANSRTHAAALIEQGQVELFQPSTSTWNKVTKSSLKISFEMSAEMVRVLSGPANRYVSRGGIKLEGALNHASLNVNGLRVLDVGTSTGGFADCCLQQNAAFVVGVDVGHGQLAPSLSQHPNLVLYEGVNAKNLSSYKTTLDELQRPFDLIVGDLSFISITTVFPHLRNFLSPQGHVLFLVKPQFELDSKALNKSGIVKAPRSYDLVKIKILESCIRSQLQVLDYFDSPIEGKDGNREFFVFATPVL